MRRSHPQPPANLNVAHACVTREVNGPGRRFTVWVQGCPRRCEGCFNPGLRTFETRREVLADELAAEAAAAGGFDGVTLTGGEPFHQAGGLAAFLDALRGDGRFARIPALAFTGYRLEELREGPAEWRRLLERLDLLVDGPYLAGEPSTLPLRGSANQRLLALTPAGEALVEATTRASTAAVEVLISDSGEVVLAGFPTAEVARRIANAFEI